MRIYKRTLLTVVILLFASITLSCSGSKHKIKNFVPFEYNPDLIPEQSYQYYDQKDYIEHLSFLSTAYLSTPGIETVLLPNEQNHYLQSIFTTLATNNELLLRPINGPKFFILKNYIPLYFSLPGGKIFLSLGLIQKYIRNEADLLSVLAFEFIKSYLNLYPTNIIIPKGFISTEKILALTRIPTEDKLKINNWVYFILQRSGHDPYIYLTWIQQQNKNSLEFSTVLGDIKNVTREESVYKYFIISKKLDSAKPYKIKKNSSKEFYKFINYYKTIVPI
ncbi:MAG: hypothetical protein HQK52_05550 [Oligoflexia bacterium]|nr:hypothetical protein [Oligoflexia bacterium]